MRAMKQKRADIWNILFLGYNSALQMSLRNI